MNLLEQVEDLWKHGAEKKAARWAENLKGAKKSVLSAKKRFHEWYPLKVYLCYTDAIKAQPEFSLRYLGQEVATLQVEESGDVSITILPKTAEVNGKQFGISLKGNHD